MIANATRIGIRISIYDDHDNELRHAEAWAPTDSAALAEWRETYDAICAAIWDSVGTLCNHSREDDH